MVQVFYYCAVLLIAFIVGFSIVLQAGQLQRNWLPKSFLIGTAVITIVTFWVSNLYSKGLRRIAGIEITTLLLLAFVLIYIRREYALRYFKTVGLSHAVGFFLCFFAGLIPLAAYLTEGAQFPYCDGYTYICNGDYLLDYGYRVVAEPEELILHPWMSQTYLYQVNHFRIGAQMLLSLWSGFFNVKFSLELFLPTMSLGIFLCGTAAWGFAEGKYLLSGRSRVLVIILLVFNVPILLWSALYGFLPQVMGSAFCLASVTSFIEIERWKENDLWNAMTTALLIAVFALIYNEMLPFFVLAVLSIVIRSLIFDKKDGIRILLRIACSAVFSLLLIIVYVPGLIQAILGQFGNIVGWDQNRDIFTYLAHFLSTVPAEYIFSFGERRMLNYVYEILTLAVFALTVWGWHKSKKEMKGDFLCVSMPYLLMFVYFMFFTVNPFLGGRGNSWSIFKLMQYYFIIAIPFLAAFIGNAVSGIHKSFLTVGVILLMLFNASNAMKYGRELSNVMKGYVGKDELSLEEYYVLYERYGESDAVIALRGVPDKHRQMITYFLKDVSLVSDWKTDDYFGIIPEQSAGSLEYDICLVYDLEDESNIAGMVEVSAD